MRTSEAQPTKQTNSPKRPAVRAAFDGAKPVLLIAKSRVRISVPRGAFIAVSEEVAQALKKSRHLKQFQRVD